MNRCSLQFFNRAMTCMIVVVMLLPLGLENSSRAAAQEASSVPNSPESSGQFPHAAAQTAADAENVEFVGHIGGSTEAVAVQGDYAYIGEGPRLTILDISDPASPTVVGKTLPLPGIVQGVAIAGDYAYVAGGGGLVVVDVSNPANPTEVGFYNTPVSVWSAWDVVVVGGFAYVPWGDAGLRVVDVSNPANPTEVGFYDTPGWAYGVAVAGGYAYVADREGGLRVVDVSTPANPTEVGFYDTPGCAYAHRVAVAGDYAYVADGKGGLQVVDISTPSDPREVGSYDTPSYAWGVAVAGGYAYVADGDGGLVILHFLLSTSAFIPLDGGTLFSAFDQTTYIFPAGTFTDTVVITHTLRLLSEAPSPGDLIGIGHFFDVTAIYSDTGQPAQLAPGQIYTVTVQYTEAEKGPAIENTLGLYWWDGGDWSQQGITSSVNLTDNLVTAQVEHLSLFAVLGETRRVYLPLVLKY